MRSSLKWRILLSVIFTIEKAPERVWLLVGTPAKSNLNGKWYFSTHFLLQVHIHASTFFYTQVLLQTHTLRWMHSGQLRFQHLVLTGEPPVRLSFWWIIFQLQLILGRLTNTLWLRSLAICFSFRDIQVRGLWRSFQILQLVLLWE